MKEEDREFGSKKAKLGNVNLTARFPSLSTLTTLAKALCTLPGAVTPYATCTANDKGARAHLSDDVG
jgi:hypothetical protein